jgi:hypothetical protein
MASRATRAVRQRTPVSPSLSAPRGAKKKMNQDTSLRIRTMYAQKSERRPVVNLGPDIKAKIGMQLRLMYGEIVDRGVPDRFVQMLKRLDDPNCEGR